MKDERPEPNKFNQLQKFKKKNVEYFPNVETTMDQDDYFFNLDAALITLPTSFNLDRFVNPVCLPNKFGPLDDSWNGEMFTITGFGRIKNKDYPTKLHIGETTL